MTVKELIEELKKYDDGLDVVIDCNVTTSWDYSELMTDHITKCGKHIVLVCRERDYKKEWLRI